jgi:drug/metabolite transporter (DMT)-like permease
MASSSVGDPSPVSFLIAVVLAAGLALLIFRHADRHGSRHATAWGLLTFLAALIVIPLYFLNYWLGKNRDRHPR